MRALPRSLWLLLGGCLLLALVLFFDLIPFLRGGFGWQWGYEAAPLLRVLPAALAILVYCLGLVWLLRWERAWPLLAWSLGGVVLLTLAALAVRSDNVIYELFVRTASGLVTGPHLAGAEIDWSNWLNWPQTMAAFEGRSVHVVQSGPGLPLWYAGLDHLLDGLPALSDPLQRALLPYQCQNYALLAYSPGEWASAWFGMLMPLWAGLAVFPLYSITRRLSGDSTARYAVGWWPLVPALLVFTPTWNTVFPLLALLIFWLLLRGLDGSPAWLLTSGLLCGLLLFANYAPVPLLGLLGSYTLLHFRAAPRRAVIAGVWFGLGLVLPWGIYWMASGLSPVDLLSFALAGHLDLARAYLPWLWLHFWEWALLTGIPLIVLWLWLSIRRRLATPASTLGLALALTMLILILSGTARGETGRVWLFFAPFVLISAAAGLDSLGRSAAGWRLVTLGQAALLLVLLATWNFIEAGDMQPPPEPPGAVMAGQSADADFAGLFRLTGWDAETESDAIVLRLNWDAEVQMTKSYWFAALLVAPDGSTPEDAVVWQPLETRYPTTCWRPGQTVGDTIRLPLPDHAQTGDWWLSLSAFADESRPEAHLPVTLADGTQDTQLGLGPVPQSSP